LEECIHACKKEVELTVAKVARYLNAAHLLQDALHFLPSQRCNSSTHPSLQPMLAVQLTWPILGLQSRSVFELILNVTGPTA
jgi:hypothetical protein